MNLFDHLGEEAEPIDFTKLNKEATPLGGTSDSEDNSPLDTSNSEGLLIESSIGLSSPKPTSEENRTNIQQLELLENEDLAPAEKSRIISETPKQLQPNSCVLSSLTAIEANVFMKGIESPQTLEKIRIDLAEKRGQYTKKKGITQPNTEKLVEDLKYKVFHPQDDAELLKMLESGDKGAIMFVKHKDERNHAVAVHIDKKTGKLIIGDPDSNPALSQENRTTILSATEEEIKKLTTNDVGESTLGNVLVVGDVNSEWVQPKTNGQEKDQSIVKPEDWLTKQEEKTNEQVSRLKTGKKQELDKASDEAKQHIDRQTLERIESELNELYDQQHRPQAETLKGQLKRSYDRGLKDAFDIDLKRAIVSHYLLGQVKKTTFGDSDNPADSTSETSRLKYQIDEETKWANGEYKIGNRRLSQVSTVLELMHPQTEEQFAKEKSVENAIQKAIGLVEQLRAADETDAEEDFILEIVQKGIMNREYNKAFIDLIDRWVEKDSDSNAERNRKNNLQEQFKYKFEQIIIKNPSQSAIRDIEQLAQAHRRPYEEVRYEIRDILGKYPIPNSRLEQRDRLTTESINSITNALMDSGLKISEINELNSIGVFDAGDTQEKTRLRKQLLRAAVDYVTVANTAEEQVMDISEYAELTDEDKEKLYTVIATSDLSTGMATDNPELQSRLQELGEKISSVKKFQKENNFSSDKMTNDTLKETEHQISVIQNGIIEYVQQNIDKLANLYRNPEDVKKMGGNNFISQIVGIYLDRLSENISNPPDEFDNDKKNKLNSLQDKLQSGLDKDTNLVFDTQREALKNINVLKEKKKQMETVTTNPYLKHLRRSAASGELSYLENVDVIAREEGKVSKSDGKPKSDTLSVKPKEEELERAREDLHKLYEQESLYDKASLIAALRESLSDINNYSFEEDDWEMIFSGLISHDDNKKKHAIDRLEDGLEDSQILQLKKAINKWRTEKAHLYMSSVETNELIKPKDEDGSDEAGSAGLRAA